jgi:hypothetical protein
MRSIRRVGKPVHKSNTRSPAPKRPVDRNSATLFRMAFLGLVLWQLPSLLLSIMSPIKLDFRTLLSISQIKVPENTFDGLPHRKKNSRLLVVAAVPRDERHVHTLWSQLECYTTTVDHVVVSAPYWSKKITKNITDLARTSIPHFASGQVTLEAQFYVNDRYDVGLWCDALETVNKDDFDEFGIINDSVFALREYSEIYDSLKARNISMSSLSYSHHGKFFRGYGPEHFWVESVFRSLTKNGLKTFMNYSCVDASNPLFCPDGDKNKKKECVIVHFEQDIVGQFPRDQVDGMYFSDAPPALMTGKNKAKHTWVVNPPYWRKLVKEQQFPAAKENVKGMIDNLNHPLLRNCTRYLDRPQLKALELDFSAAVHGLDSR